MRASFGQRKNQSMVQPEIRAEKFLKSFIINKRMEVGLWLTALMTIRYKEYQIVTNGWTEVLQH